MSNGTENLERNKPRRSEFGNENVSIVHRIALEAVRANRRAERRTTAANRRAMTADHAGTLAE